MNLQQVINIMEPHPHDVLSGRGAGILKWPGNKRWRELIKEKQTEYVRLRKHEKTFFTQSIVFAVRSLSPPGRFLAKDKRGRWYEIGEAKANEKTAQALREGAPKLRKRLSESSKSSRSSNESQNQSISLPMLQQTSPPQHCFSPLSTAPHNSPQHSPAKPSNYTSPEQNYNNIYPPMMAANESASVTQTYSDPWIAYMTFASEAVSDRIEMVDEINSEALKLFNDDTYALVDGQEEAKHSSASCLDWPLSLQDNDPTDCMTGQKPAASKTGRWHDPKTDTPDC